MGECRQLAAAASSLNMEGNALTVLIIGMGAYLLAMIIIGLLASRKISGISDFIVAGRRLPLWMATATMMATWFGAGSSMGVSATVYSEGLRGVLADPFGASISLLIAGVFIVGPMRKCKYLTVTDIIENQYGRAAGIYASLWMLPVYIGWLGAQLLGIGTILHILTGMDVKTAALVSGAVVLIYTFSGGMWAVTLTDVIQVGLIAIGLFAIVPGVICEAGGMAAVMGNLKSADFSVWAVPASGEGSAGFSDWVFWSGNLMMMGLGCAVGQDLLQRSLSSRTSGIAVASSIMSGFLYFLVAAVPILIGFAARIVLPKYGVTAEMLGDDVGNQVLPRMAIIILGKMHPIVLTIFLSALVSAIMSSADSSLLAATSLFCKNVVGASFTGISDKAMLMLTRVSTLGFLLVSMFFAFYVESIYQLMINSWVSQLVVIFMPVVGALYLPRSSKNTAWSCMVVATAVWLGYTFLTSCGSGKPLVELLNSTDTFGRNLVCGAVYGFVAGVIAFFFSYWGETMSSREKRKSLRKRSKRSRC